MLTVNPYDRPSAREVLKHEVFMKEPLASRPDEILPSKLKENPLIIANELTAKNRMKEEKVD